MNTTVITPAALPVSQIGIGCVTFGREIDEGSANALLDHALARGVRLFDTAAAYGQGASEAILGRWLTSRRPSGITVATKILPPYDRANIEASLKRLGVDHIDLLYLHQWHPTAESAEALRALDALVCSGKIRALGASNFNQEQLQAVLAAQQQQGLTRFSVVQNNHNLAVSDVSLKFRAFCATEGIAIVTYSPLGAGFLTSKHQAGVQPGSRFDLVPGHQDVYFHEVAYRRLARLEAVAARSGNAQADLALAWVLNQPGIASVLVGGRTLAHLDQAFAALHFSDAAVLAELVGDEAEAN
jgi:aryl-alcohol dehydrogenase-like predicted oxidoreductase